jgi:16S rRNA (uracil1498-N3)-methyltransferase
MPRFYCSPPLPVGDTFDLPPEAAHHAARVLRLREGNRIEVFDGLGHECHGTITALNGKRVIVGNLTTIEISRESPLNVLLAQALSSSEKMDWIIQKATELGAAEIQPLNTERSVARLSAERTARRLEHWRQIAISACEQCGRNVLPEIHTPLDVMTWLQQIRETPDKFPTSKFVLLPQGTALLHNCVQPQNEALLLVGAEGGFTESESDSALLCGFSPVRMGTRVMRTETAAIAGLAALQTLWGDFN